MPRPSSRSTARRPVVVAALLAVVVLIATACDPVKANTDYALVNQLRASRGLTTLTRSPALDKKAADHAAAMAAKGTLFHSNLAAGVPAGWKSLAENVAMAGSVEAAQQALEASPPHLANLTNPALTEVGIGVKTVNGVVYLVQVFAQR
jgi:uncharacterized protein YkwD